MPDLTKRGFKKPLKTEPYDLDIVNYNTDKTNELFESQDDINKNINNQISLKQSKIDENLNTDDKTIVGAVNENKDNIDVLSQQMEHKADKQWMANNWKNESDLPSAYPNNSITYFKTYVAWNSGKILAGATIKTTKSYNFITLQEASRSYGVPLFYRMVDTSTTDWGAWQEIATTESGTWTPTIRGNTGVGSNVYAAQVGRYVKTGKIVVLSFRVVLSEKDVAMTGVVLIGGLPFLPKDKRDANYNFGQISLRDITLTSDERFYILARSNILEIQKQMNTVIENLGVVRLNNNTTITGSITYEIE
jgi:oligoribonuclease (3'-5' exoribonuclease)